MEKPFPQFPQEAGYEETLNDAISKDYKNPEIIYSLTHYVNDLHRYLMENIIFSDHKAGFLFAAVATVLAYLHSKGLVGNWFKNPSEWGLLDIISMISIIALVISALATMFVVIPRLQGSPKGIIYWKAIKCYPQKKEFADDVLSTDMLNLIRLKLENCYELADINERKYRMLTVAMWSGCIGLVLAAVYLAAK